MSQAPYSETWELQKNLQKTLIDSGDKEHLIICEHPLTITLGTSTKEQSLRTDLNELQSKGVEVHKVKRGGDATCHEPGQFVAYPILDLKKRKRDVGWFLRSLEETIISSLGDYKLEGLRVQGKTGVWVQSNDSVTRKIASIGVRLSRWVSMHGLAINVNNDLRGFAHIHPCGYKDIEMTSLSRELGSKIDLIDFSNRFEENFLNFFD